MKPQYRVRKWSEYNTGLKQRGSLTIWIEDQAIAQWLVPQKSGKPGASPYYSDLAVTTKENGKPASTASSSGVHGVSYTWE